MKCLSLINCFVVILVIQNSYNLQYSEVTAEARSVPSQQKRLKITVKTGFNQNQYQKSRNKRHLEFKREQVSPTNIEHERKFPMFNENISGNLKDDSQTVQRPKHTANVLQANPVSRNTPTIHDSKLNGNEYDYEEESHDEAPFSYRNAQENMRRSEDNGGVAKPGEQSFKLNRILKFVKNELREDTFAPKEWNSSRVILKNLRLGGTESNQMHGKYNNNVGGTGVNTYIRRHSPVKFVNRRGIIKRQLKPEEVTDSAADVKITATNKNSRQIEFNTQSGSIEDSAGTRVDTGDPTPNIVKENKKIRKSDGKFRDTAPTSLETGEPRVFQTTEDKTAPNAAEINKNTTGQTEIENDYQTKSVEKKVADDKTVLSPDPVSTLPTQSQLASTTENVVGGPTTQAPLSIPTHEGLVDPTPLQNEDLYGIKNTSFSFVNMTRDNSSNIVKMNFGLDIPDSNFNLKIERKSLDKGKRNFWKTKSKYNGKEENNFRKRKPFSQKHKHFGTLIQKGRRSRSLAFHFENSHNHENYLLDKDSKHVLPNHGDFSGVRDISEQNQPIPDKARVASKVRDGKSERLRSNTVTPVKLDHKLSGLSSPINPVENVQNISISSADIPRSKKSSLNLAHKNVRTQDFSSIMDENHNDDSDTVEKRDSDNKTVKLRLVNELSPKDSQKLLKLIESNVSNPDNDSYIEFEGENAIYLLYVPPSENGSITKDIEIVKMLQKSSMWDNVHYVEERSVENKIKPHECCRNVYSLIKRNPFAVAVALAACCMVIVVMLIGVFIMVERRLKNKKSPVPISRKGSSDYKVIRMKKGIVDGKVKKGERNQSKETSLDNSDDRTNKKNITREKNLEKGQEKPKKVKFEQSAHAKGLKKDRGLLNRATNWVRRTISTVPLSDTDDDAADAASKRDSGSSGSLSGDSPSESDKTYVSKRQRFKRFVKTRGGRRKLPRKTKMLAPDLRSTLKNIKRYLSEDEKSIQSFAATSFDLKGRITTTGDCQQIDSMLIRGYWEKAYFTAHGLDKITDEQNFADHSPEERRKINMEKIEIVSGQSPGGIGILSKGSSSHSLKSAIGRSINTAEWINQHPRPISNRVLKEVREIKNKRNTKCGKIEYQI